MMKNYTSLFGVLLLMFSAAKAQDKITLKDAKEISYQAKATVEGLERLLNYVTFSENIPSELQEVIAGSYKPTRNRIFYSKDIVLEDDLLPESAFGKTKDISAEKYLNDLDIHYEKTKDASIAFSNYAVSSVKKKDYVYVRVKFASKFGSKFKPKNAGYQQKDREALVRVESEGGGKWKALIVGVNFFNPENPIESTENNIGITTDESLNAAIVSEEEFARERENFIREKEEEEKKNNAIFDEYVSLAANNIGTKQYKDALALLEKAKEIKPLVPTLDKKILEAKRLIAENTYENFKNKADKAKRERRFTDAIQFYKEAIALNPTASGLEETEIKPLTIKLNLISLPKNKVESGDLEGAIDACDDLLKQNKKAKNEFPELFYTKGLAYMAMVDKKADDSKSLDRALDNFNQAIEFFPNYIDARKARATLFVKHKKDYVSAITDYDVLTTNALDDSPEKQVYYITKAKWKNAVANNNGALEDYAKAIALNSKNPVPFYERGELQYRLKSYAEALKDLNVAIGLDPKYTAAYYHRGLNFVELKNPLKAGADFTEAEKLGLDADKIKNIEAISQNYFNQGNALLSSKDLKMADSIFNSALEIRQCNSLAMNGKAEIRYLTAESLREKYKAADSKKSFEDAISWYRKAIVCNPKYSDAQLREGMAHHQIAEYDKALSSYSDAISSNAANVKALVERGNTYQVIKQYPKAADDYKAAVALLTGTYEATKKGKDKKQLESMNRELSSTLTLQGEALYRSKDYANATVAIDKAIEFIEDNAEAIYYRGLIFEAQEDLSKALKSYAEAIKIAPSYKYYYSNGVASYKSKNYPAAISNFDFAIKLDTLPVYKDKFYMRGLSYFKTKTWENALNDFNEYAKLDVSKKDSSFFSDNGLLHLYLNRDSVAVQNFNHALTFNSNNPQALFGLGCAYAKSGKFDKALELLEQAYKTRMIKKDQYELEEDTFLAELIKVKANKSKYNALKKAYLASTK